MSEELILKQFSSEVKVVEGERALNVTITTNDVDRIGDIVESKGARMVNFKKNPVVLMAHDYQGLPIGKAKDLTKTDNGITAKVIFPEEGIYGLADTVYNLYKNKFMKAWSIGFMPIKSEEITGDDDKDEGSKSCGGGRRFKVWELLEFSACSVPCNPHALTNMVAKGIDIEPLKEAGFIEIEEEVCPECGSSLEVIEEGKHIHCTKCDWGENNRDVEPTAEIKELIKDGLKDVKVNEIDEEKVKASIEKDEKEEKEEKEEIKLDVKEVFPNLEFDKDSDKFTIDGDEIIDRLYELVTENKELKEKIEKLKTAYESNFDKIVSKLEEKIKDIELKAGAVLNAKNKKDLKDAQKLNQDADALIQSVLDSATTGEEEDSLEITDEKGEDDKGDNTATDLETDTADDPPKDEKEDEDKIEVDEKVIAETINKHMNYLVGKLDKSDT